MIEEQKLYDYAALRLCPDNIENGKKQIDAIVKKLAFRSAALVWARIFLFPTGIIITFWMLYLASTPKFLQFDASLWQYTLWMFRLILGLSLLILCSIRKETFQKRTCFLTKKRRYDTNTPKEIEILFDDIASGEIKALASTIKGLEDSTKNYPIIDNHTMNLKIRSEIINNRYAPLFLSSSLKHYNLVFLPKEIPFTSHIYITPPPRENISEPAPIGSPHLTTPWWLPENEKPNLNSEPFYRWLVEGTLDQFLTGLAKFIGNKYNSKKNKWLEMNLLIARHEMRKGYYEGAREAAMRKIRIELVREFDSLAIPQSDNADPYTKAGADSKETTRALMRGEYSRKKIHDFFLTEYTSDSTHTDHQ